MLFIEQEPVSKTAMHLDVNYRRVSQENYTNLKGSNFHEEIYKEGGDTYSNSPIVLMFYEKINRPNDPNIPPNELPEIFSMSKCKLKSNSSLRLPKVAFEVDQLLVLDGVTAQFVTKEQYKQLFSSFIRE